LKVSLERTFPMPAAADQAWALLQDVGRVAACMPGATITERVDDRHYKGTVAVRFGPASLSFRGEVEVAAIDAPRRTLHLIGKGTDTTGGSAAALDLTARIDPVNATSCNLAGNSEVSLNGKVAAFGGRMADSVAGQVLQQFAANFAAELQARQVAAAAAAATGPVAGDAAATTRPAEQLNGLALIWGVFVAWLRSVFGRRGA
jgi:carbon monoxide dehydrogenase subunit G